jgi:hypothetical protein
MHGGLIVRIWGAGERLRYFKYHEENNSEFKNVTTF